MRNQPWGLPSYLLPSSFPINCRLPEADEFRPHLPVPANGSAGPSQDAGRPRPASLARWSGVEKAGFFVGRRRSIDDVYHPSAHRSHLRAELRVSRKGLPMCRNRVLRPGVSKASRIFVPPPKWGGGYELTPTHAPPDLGWQYDGRLAQHRCQRRPINPKARVYPSCRAPAVSRRRRIDPLLHSPSSDPGGGGP